MSIITGEYFNGNSKGFLALDESLSDKKYGIRFDVCDNAACDCSDLQVTLVEHNDKKHINSAEFKVDVCLKQRTDKNFNQSNNDLVESIIKQLDTNDWKTLWKVFSDFKLKVTENIDFERTFAKFPMARDIELHGELVSYGEILPHGAKFTLGEIDDEISCVLLDEQYCLIRGCTCSNVAMAFISIQGGVQKKEEPPLVQINYRTGEIKSIDVGSGTKESILEAWNQFNEKYPNLLDNFSKRHIQLNKLYENYRRSSYFTNATVINLTKTPGRNDPCSCGSGKKFKKCCLALASSHKAAIPLVDPLKLL